MSAYFFVFNELITIIVTREAGKSERISHCLLNFSLKSAQIYMRDIPRFDAGSDFYSIQLSFFVMFSSEPQTRNDNAVDGALWRIFLYCAVHAFPLIWQSAKSICKRMKWYNIFIIILITWYARSDHQIASKASVSLYSTKLDSDRCSTRIGIKLQREKQQQEKVMWLLSIQNSPCIPKRKGINRQDCGNPMLIPVLITTTVSDWCRERNCLFGANRLDAMHS